jgi:DNA polymerase (family 10)
MPAADEMLKTVENRSLNDKLEDKILKGRINILKDGNVDISNDVLNRTDVASAGIHSFFSLSSDEMTKRLLKTIENPNVDIIVHPTGRQIQRKSSISFNIEKVIEAAKTAGTTLDIDSYPDRLDLKDEHIRKAVEIGAKLGISSDSHSKAHMLLDSASPRREKLNNTGHITRG